MAHPEQEPEPAHLSHIGLDLHEGVVSLFGTRGDALLRFRFFLPAGLQHLLASGSLIDRSVDRFLEETEPSAEAAPAAVNPGKTPTLVLPGKLQTQPVEGRPDRQRKPTAWARFLARVEGREGATLLSASFHGRTREIALGLSAGDQLTAQGYLHLRPLEDERLSTFSVIHLVHYPGKPDKGAS